LQAKPFPLPFPPGPKFLGSTSAGAHTHLYDLRSAHFSPTCTVLFLFLLLGPDRGTDGKRAGHSSTALLVLSPSLRIAAGSETLFYFRRLDPVDPQQHRACYNVVIGRTNDCGRSDPIPGRDTLCNSIVPPAPLRRSSFTTTPRRYRPSLSQVDT
jgi:hypothetical protein